jgi:hypothetical protein
MVKATAREINHAIKPPASRPTIRTGLRHHRPPVGEGSSSEAPSESLYVLLRVQETFLPWVSVNMTSIK